MRRLILLLTLLGPMLMAAPTPEPPPRDVRLTEKKLEELVNRDFDDYGKQALAIAPAKWKHAETDNFIVHYRRVTEAKPAVREIEFDLWFVAQTLGASKERYAKKSHVFIFQCEKEWREFLAGTKAASWSASFARGDELFLHVGGMGEGFDSGMLAHETTHAVVARLYPDRCWPVWLNEGLAEYMSGAAVSARKGQFIGSLQRDLKDADLPLDQLTRITQYPASQDAVRLFYRSSERLIRFLMTEFPKERITSFVEAVLSGVSFEKAVVQVYGDQVGDFETFQRKFARFTK